MVENNTARTDNGSTPLFIACDKGHAEMVELLLARDATDVNKARTVDGASPLYIACYNRRTEVVVVLLARDRLA